MSITIFDLELPDLSTDQAPAFTNAEECQKWLAGISSPNARQTQAQLLRQINLLNRYAMPVDERLKVLADLSGIRRIFGALHRAPSAAGTT